MVAQVGNRHRELVAAGLGKGSCRVLRGVGAVGTEVDRCRAGVAPGVGQLGAPTAAVAVLLSTVSVVVKPATVFGLAAAGVATVGAASVTVMFAADCARRRWKP